LTARKQKTLKFGIHFPMKLLSPPKYRPFYFFDAICEILCCLALGGMHKIIFLQTGLGSRQMPPISGHVLASLKLGGEISKFRGSVKFEKSVRSQRHKLEYQPENVLTKPHASSEKRVFWSRYALPRTEKDQSKHPY